MKRSKVSQHIPTIIRDDSDSKTGGTESSLFTHLSAEVDTVNDSMVPVQSRPSDCVYLSKHMTASQLAALLFSSFVSTCTVRTRPCLFECKGALCTKVR